MSFMSHRLDISEFLENAEPSLVIDVRSPGEFQQGHIPAAENVPLFTDAERARIGTCYKQQGRQPAIMLGLDIVGPKMRSLAEQAQQLASDRGPLVHCWRGGMRSSSFAWLLEQIGMSPCTLIGGYRSFRRAAQAAFEVERPIIVLAGMTGAGKTKMLHGLASAGEQTLDLEQLANHRGSSFGGIGLPPQPTCEQFENELFMRLRELDPAKPVWIEDESPSIGKVRVPDKFWWSMRQSPAIFLDVSRQQRAMNLAQEYGRLDGVELEAATLRLEQKLGRIRTKELTTALRHGDMHAVALGLLAYYDKTYSHAAAKRPRQHVHRLSGDITVDRIIQFAAEHVC